MLPYSWTTPMLYRRLVFCCMKSISHGNIPGEHQQHPINRGPISRWYPTRDGHLFTLTCCHDQLPTRWTAAFLHHVLACYQDERPKSSNLFFVSNIFHKFFSWSKPVPLFHYPGHISKRPRCHCPKHTFQDLNQSMRAAAVSLIKSLIYQLSTISILLLLFFCLSFESHPPPLRPLFPI